LKEGDSEMLHLECNFVRYGADIWRVWETDHKYIERFETWCWISAVTIGIDRVEKKTYKPSFNEERNIVRPVERRKDNWIERQNGRKDEEEEDISSYFVTLRKRDNWTGHVLRRNCLSEICYWRKDRKKGREDEEEDIGSYFVTLRKRDNWTGHVLRRNCLLKYVIGGKIERREGKTKKKT